MAHLIPLSRLARMVGKPRAQLQQMAQRGELQTFDGSVALEEVLRVFPDVELEDDAELRRVEAIKDQALVLETQRQAEELALPNPALLQERLRALGRDFATAQARLMHYQRVHGWLDAKFLELVDSGMMDHAASRRLMDWLRRELTASSTDLAQLERFIAKERVMQVMSAQVTVQPRGQTFEVLGNETLLEAGLKAGLTLPYGCSNGSCGECKCRIVEGSVVKVRPHDFVLSAAEKRESYTLTCAYSAVGDVTLELPALGPADIPLQEIKVRVRALEPLSPGRMAVHLLTSRAERLRYLAGQWLDITINGETRRVPAASCPCDERRIEVHVPCDRGEGFDRDLRESLKVNDEVVVRGPFGEFVLDDSSTRPLLLVAEGAGFGPVKSLLQHALSLDQAPSITLFRLAGDEGLYQENLLNSYASALDNFFYRPYQTGADCSAAFASLIAEQGSIAGHDVYVVGSDALIRDARERCLAAGLPHSQWHAAVTE